MINLQIRKRFIKDLKSIKGSIYYEIVKNFVFVDLKNVRSVDEIKNIKKLRGFKNIYRIKISDYRIGLTIESNKVIVERVLHRKDIYQHFPSK